MNKLYYVINIDFDSVNEEAYLTGHKDIDIYEIVDNDLELKFTLSLDMEDNSEEAIEEQLNYEYGKLGYKYELVRL